MSPVRYLTSLVHVSMISFVSALLGVSVPFGSSARAAQGSGTERIAEVANEDRPEGSREVGADEIGRTGITRLTALDALVEEALRANLTLEAARLGEQRAADAVGEAIGLWLPQVSLESRLSRIEGGQDLGDLINPAYAALNDLTGTRSFPTDLELTLPQEHETRLRLTQPIVAEELRANLALQRARHAGAESEFRATARRVAALTQITYLQAASAQRVVEIQEAALGIVRENERVTERLRAAGSANPEAVHQARADRAEVEQALAEAREQRTAAVREFNRILQRPLDTAPPTIPDSALVFPLRLEVEAAVAQALASREELAASEAGIRAAGAAHKAATARYLPTLGLALDYGFQGAEPSLDGDQDYWMASVVAEWSLFDRSREAARSGTRREVERAEVARRDLALAIENEVRNAHEAAVVAQEAIEAATIRAEAERRTFEFVQRRYAEGAASPLELVDARTAATAAELNLVLTTYRFAMRWVDLERAAALRPLDDLEGGSDR